MFSTPFFYPLIVLHILLHPLLASISPQQQKQISALDAKIDELCGAHPLQSILDKIASHHRDATHDELVKILSVLKVKAPRIWSNYEKALRIYENCKILAASGSLG